MKDTITDILIVLDVASKPSLGILLSADGCINRLGTGSVANDEHDLYIGLTDEPLFERLREMVRPEWFQCPGGYTVNLQEGRACELRITIRHSDGKDTLFVFQYGSESRGPPADICRFTLAAVALTQPWYEEQKRLVGRAARGRKPWLKFW